MSIETPKSVLPASIETSHQLERGAVLQQTHMGLEALSKLIAPVATIALVTYGIRTMLKGTFG